MKQSERRIVATSIVGHELREKLINLTKDRLAMITNPLYRKNFEYNRDCIANVATKWLVSHQSDEIIDRELRMYLQKYSSPDLHLQFLWDAGWSESIFFGVALSKLRTDLSSYQIEKLLPAEFIRCELR